MREERRDRQQGARVRGGMGGPMRGLALNEKARDARGTFRRLRGTFGPTWANWRWFLSWLS